MSKSIPPSIIALDGPAASGKSTLGRKLADALGYLFFDTGVMYRAITWIALQQKMDLRDETAVTRLAEALLRASTITRSSIMLSLTG